jgi:hypothetical protein
VPPLLVLQARAEARSILYGAGEFFDINEAIAPLMQYAFNSGIDDQIGAAIIKAAFAGVAEE